MMWTGPCVRERLQLRHRVHGHDARGVRAGAGAPSSTWSTFVDRW